MEDILTSVSEALATPSVTGWEDTVFDFTAPVPQPEPLVTCGGEMIVTRQNICVITGKQKSYKSTFLACMIASCVSGVEVLNMTATKPLKCLYADTEQASYHLSCQCNRIARLSGGVIGEITVLELRPYSPDERYNFILDAVEALRPDVLFIDGISDLCNDVNASEEAEKLVSSLLAVSSQYNIGIVTIIHSLASLGKLRGHLGSTLERKCESSIFLERSGMGDEIKVKPKESRNKPFRSFSFVIGENGDPEYHGPENSPQTATDWLVYLMAPNVEYRNQELVKMLAEKGFKASNAQYAISSATAKDYIHRVGDAYTVTLNKSQSVPQPPYIGG